MTIAAMITATIIHSTSNPITLLLVTSNIYMLILNLKNQK